MIFSPLETAGVTRSASARWRRWMPVSV